jgi:hypothetical protein
VVLVAVEQQLHLGLALLEIRHLEAHHKEVMVEMPLVTKVAVEVAQVVWVAMPYLVQPQVVLVEQAFPIQ